MHGLWILLRLGETRYPHPIAAIIDSRTLQTTPESGARAGSDGAKRRNGSKVHIAVDTPGHLLVLHVTPANEQDSRIMIRSAISSRVQEVTDQSVKLAYVDYGYTGDRPAEAAEAHGIVLEVVKLPEAKKGFVLLPRRWVVERSFGRMARFRRLARDSERLPETLAGIPMLASLTLMVARLVDIIIAGRQVHNTLKRISVPLTELANQGLANTGTQERRRSVGIVNNGLIIENINNQEQPTNVCDAIWQLLQNSEL